MKIAQINITTSGSTGKIMLQLANISREKGDNVKTYTPILFEKGKRNIYPDIYEHFYWGKRRETFIHYYVGVLFGVNGLMSKSGTKKMLQDLDEFKPDIIHLHNIHQFCINLPLLFKYIKKNRIRVIWTLHDCWAFTGHCPYFDMIKCEKWKEGCSHCPQPREYFKMYVDTSKLMYNIKKELFCGINDMIIVTPSEWLANLVRESFLKDYPVKVINNGIDLDIFKPTKDCIREKWGISADKKILLGVAFGWEERKGLDVFLELEKRLDSMKYQIVLVGTDDGVDKQLPEGIISIHRTNNQKELAEIYSSADIFVNPTREDNYPTVNMEAIACGTPVVTFQTGGSPEMLDKTCGVVVAYDDIDSLEHEIIRICEENPYSVENCVNKAKDFDKNDRFEEYMRLYEQVKS